MKIDEFKNIVRRLVWQGILIIYQTSCLVELAALARGAAEDHGSEMAVADRQRLLPLGGGLVIPEDVVALRSCGGGCQWGDGEEKQYTAFHDEMKPAEKQGSFRWAQDLRIKIFFE